MEHRLAVDDEEYPIGFHDMLEDPEPEDEYVPVYEEEDYYDFPSTEDDGPWHDPQEGKD
jgi:ribosomal protein S4E